MLSSYALWTLKGAIRQYCFVYIKPFNFVNLQNDVDAICHFRILNHIARRLQLEACDAGMNDSDADSNIGAEVTCIRIIRLYSYIYNLYKGR